MASKLPQLADSCVSKLLRWGGGVRVKWGRLTVIVTEEGNIT